jgi:hypothetical protein
MHVSDIIKKRGINKIYYFHTDHFEPFTGGDRVNDIKGIRNFVKRTKSFKHSKKMSLFVVIPYGRMLGTNNRKDLEIFSFNDDLVSFFIKNNSAQKVKEYIKILYESGHDIHIHVHHERWTSNNLNISKFSKSDIPLRKYVLGEGEKNDGIRLKNHLGLCVDFIKDIIPNFNSWGFVHGCWALNASDPEICKINDEIVILKEAGCIGDFSFPAGRGHCDPKIESPFTINPIVAPRSYDNPKSRQRVIGKDPGAFDKDRFLVWSSKIKHRHTSLDYYSDAIKKNLSDPNLIVNNWIKHSPVINGNLFIKTHSHSMDLRYWKNYDNPIIPITSPNVNKAFANLKNTCNKTGVSLEFISVREAVSLLKKIDKVK